MARTTKTITFSLPPELAEQVETARREEGRTMSELVREALRRYLEDREWRAITRYGQRRARALGLTPDDVERLVEEYRDEQGVRARRP